MAVCPFADQSHRYDSAYGGAYATGPWRGVLHTTETTSLPSYQGGAVAPHFTIDPARLKSYQHYDTARPSRALQHPAGTIDTNNLHAVQFEIVAYSDETIARSVGGLAVSQLTAEHYDFIAKHMRWVELAHGVQRSSGVTFKPYPASAGAGNGVRMSSSEWSRFHGWCGHQHVPNNDHGDPSNISIDQLLQGDDDVTPADRQAIVNDTTAAVVAALKAQLPAWVWLSKTTIAGDEGGLAVISVLGRDVVRQVPKNTAAIAALQTQVTNLQAAVPSAVVQALQDKVVTVDVNVTGGNRQ